MNPLVILIPVLIVLGIVVLVASARRRDTGDAIGLLARETVKRDRGEPTTLLEGDDTLDARDVERSAVLARVGGGEVATRDDAAPAVFVPPDPEQVGVSRRQFFNRSIIAFFILGISGFGAAVIGMLWPRPTEGFGAKIKLGSVAEVKDQIAANNGFLYFADGRMWLTAYPASAIAKAKAADYPATQLVGMEAGVIALWQTCPHLGCRVPECATSKWFECPCHGSQYNQVGERQGGPAPRGMDGFAMDVSGGTLTVDTGTIIKGRPLGVDTIGQEPQGPHCVTGGAH
jgi:cytochrome b6-f complex iron-sulfur subunit